MRYFLSGYYGRRNLGDDVLLYAAIEGVMRADPDAEFTVLSDVELALPPSARVSVVRTGQRRANTVRQILAHDVWLFGGGGILQDSSDRSLRSLCQMTRRVQFAKLMRRRVAFWSVGIGPIETRHGERALKRLFHLADFISVRDPESAATARKVCPNAHPSISPDLALNLLPAFRGEARQTTRSCEPRVLGISLLDLAYGAGADSETATTALSNVATGVNELLDAHPGWSVRCFVFFGDGSANGDRAVAQRFVNQIRQSDRVSICDYDGRFLSTFHAIAECSAFLGMRLHSIVLAHMADVPFVAVQYHPKCRSFCQQCGASVDSQLTLAEVSERTTIARRLHGLLEDSDRFRPAFPPEAMVETRLVAPDGMSSWIKSQLCKNRH